MYVFHLLFVSLYRKKKDTAFRITIIRVTDECHPSIEEAEENRGHNSQDTTEFTRAGQEKRQSDEQGKTRNKKDTGPDKDVNSPRNLSSTSCEGEEKSKYKVAQSL